MMQELEQAATRAGLALPAPAWDELCARYDEPARAYHNRRHLVEMAQRFDAVARDLGWKQPPEVFAALLYHDAVYLAGASDNEEKSAELARAALRDQPLDLARVSALILLTARHAALRPEDVDGEAALFLDCDMSILASDAARFDEYERAIAVEYAALSKDLFDAGRRRFLERLLASERIFLSEYFHRRLDAAARANLRRALGGHPDRPT